MSRYRVAEGQAAGLPTIELYDDATGSAAVIVPGVGAQCRSYTWSHRGERLDILVPPADDAMLREDPVHYGNPILFPFPNRIKGGTFTFEGRTVSLPANERGRGNAIHGLVVDKAWEAAGSGAGETEGAWVACRLRSDDHPAISRAYPYPFEVTYLYRLVEGRLESEVTAANVGTARMPVGFGLHPWFPLPLRRTGSRERCRLRAPVSKVWVLDEGLVPTGEIVPAPKGRDLTHGAEVGSHAFDDVYTGLADSLSQGDWSESVYADPEAGVEIAVRADSSFRELVVYAPLARNVVCLEPYTCTTDAFNLAARGVDSGMIVLEPGASWRGRVVYEPRPISA